MKTEEFFDISSDLFCIISFDGIFKRVNRALCSSVGYSAAQMVSQSIFSFIHPADSQRTREYIDNISGNTGLFENRYQCSDGRYKWFSWNFTLVPGQKLVYASARDITNEKKLEENLQQIVIENKAREEKIALNEKRFRSLVQSGSDMIALLNPDATYQYVSPTVLKLGYSMEFLIGKSPFEFIHPDDLDTVSEAFCKVLYQSELEIPIFRFKDANNQWRYISAIATNRLTDPAVNAIIVNSRDITENILQETERQRAIQRTQNLIDNFTEGYILINKYWTIINCNSKAAKLLNSTQEALLDKCLWRMFPEGNNRAFYYQYKRALNENVSVRFEEHLSSISKWFEITAYPYQDDLTVFFKDITEAKTQELTLKLEKDVLQMNTCSGNCLQSTIGHYLEGLFKIYPGMYCAVNQVRGNKIYPLSAPSMPAAYAKIFEEGIAINANSHCCGIAVDKKECVVVPDIASHPDMAQFKEFALANGLKSCWSIPVINEKKDVIAVLAVFYNRLKEPSVAERELMNRVATFTQVLIESNNIKEHLKMSSERYKLVTLASKDAIYDWDITSDKLYWGEGFERIFGYKEAITNIGWWGQRIHPEDKEDVHLSLNEALDDPEQKLWHAEYRFLKADNTYAYITENGFVIRALSGKAIRMVGAMQDHTKVYEHQYQVLKQNNTLREIAQINSHHIRKPLANILGLISTIKGAEVSEVGELIGLLETSGQELDEITREIAKKTYS